MAKSTPTADSRAAVASAPAKARADAAEALQVALPLPATYEAGLKELEGLLAGLESGQLPLDELLSSYQRGAQLVQFCRGKLEAVENQIKVLEGGELKPWRQVP